MVKRRNVLSIVWSAMGRLRKRMYERQVTKEGMSGAVKDEKLVVIVGNDCCFNSCFEFP